MPKLLVHDEFSRSSDSEAPSGALRARTGQAPAASLIYYTILHCTIYFTILYYDTLIYFTILYFTVQLSRLYDSLYDMLYVLYSHILEYSIL